MKNTTVNNTTIKVRETTRKHLRKIAAQLDVPYIAWLDQVVREKMIEEGFDYLVEPDPEETAELDTVVKKGSR